MKIKLFTGEYYVIENDVNEWISERIPNINIKNITQSSCYYSSSTVYVTVMIEYTEII